MGSLVSRCYSLLKQITVVVVGVHVIKYCEKDITRSDTSCVRIQA